MDNTFKIVKSTALPESLLMGVGAVTAGTAAAIFRGEGEMVQATICLLFAIFTQLTANFAHRYFDVTHQYGDSIDDNYYTQQFRMDNAKVVTREGTFAMLLLSVMLGLMILLFTTWWMIIPGLIIYLLIFVTNSGPWPLFRSWLSPLPPFLLFGIIGVSMTAYVQVMYDNPYIDEWYFISPMVFYAISVGFLAANVQLIHNYITADRDRENLKGSFAVTFGKTATIWTVFIFGVLMMVTMSVFAFTQHVRYPIIFLIAPAICFIVNCWITFRMDRDNSKLGRISKYAIYNVLLFGVLLLIMGLAMGDPDRSRLLLYPDQIRW